MLNFFRNLTKSRYGVIAVFIFLAIIAIAFAAGDITGVRNMGGGAKGNVLVRVGNSQVTDAQLRDRIDRFLRNAQRDGQNITMEQFLAQGGLDLALDEMVNATALAEFAQDSGMKVSKRLIDGEIASTPAFFGLDGKFSQKAFEDLLAQNRISPAMLREGMTQDRYGNWLVNRVTIGTQVPEGVALPYASLMLERRTGTVGLIQSVAMDPGPDPNDKTLAAFFTANQARYMVPQRRVVRYALVKPDALRAGAAATEAEIADAFRKQQATRFAATQKRSVELVTTLDQATAAQVAAKAKGGSLAAAATSSGLEARTFTALEKSALAQQVSDAFANAAFAAQPNAVVGPTRVGGNWLVFRVTGVEQVAAKTLDQVRGDLATEITTRKTTEALAAKRQALDDGLGDGKTFDEAVRDAGLAAVRTPALTAQGTNPDDPNFKPDPLLGPVLQSAFAAEEAGGDPEIVQVAPDGSFAVVAVDQIVQAAPRPLAQIRDKVKADYLMDKAHQKARAAAAAVVAKLQKGVPMQQALAEAGVTKGAPPKPFDMKRADVLGKQVPPYVQMAFTMAPKTAKLVEGPNRMGFYVVQLDAVEEHSAAGDRAAIARVQAEIGQQAGAEQASQFVASIRNHLKVVRNEAAIARLRADLTRTGSAR
ncbi:MAG: SurA N-terminal domain-containing protein [Sphingomonas sp.]|uniref:peptidylprolyl isomerase n=1 Tax=Sphingomonas sp. TaxID=28214 RepID=UPI001B29F2B2|nr:peptidylprolyl isomerase [Sphingomonas sp.]MBO9622890.1 SurA N-terminal domain-containing protein [Sphingomonas sp.]